MDSQEQWVPAAELVDRLTVPPLPERWTALDCLLVVKCFDEHGSASWTWRATAGLSLEDVLGALMVHAELIRQKLVGDSVAEDDRE